MANNSLVPDLSNFPLTKPLANRFREVVSGSKDGTPKWAFQMLEGEDEGYFGPESAVWEVHGCVSTIVGGVRALLLQAAHPAALAGVAEHSRYQEDPLGRLAGTTKWLTITSFGAKEFIEKEAKRVNEMHSRVTGSYLGKDGAQHEYAAKQSEYLMWVHCAFTDGFLKTYEMLGYKFKTSADQYVSEWAESAVPLGLTDAPKSVAELEARLEEFRANSLLANETTLNVVKFIMKPPFSKLGLIPFSIFAFAAVATLDPRDRELLGLKKRSRIWLKISRVILEFLSAILGNESPSQKFARQRIARLRK
ncbi:MAG: hypothetical protein RL193_1215 [Actinomycetota bacterium]|jgi:uncharacterized protein (DUF2236 family)